MPSGCSAWTPRPGRSTWPRRGCPARAFDVHTHFGPFDFDVPDVPDAELIGALRTPPTDAAVASSAVGIFGDPARGNDQAIRAVAGTRGAGQLAYVVADPSDVEFSRGQLRSASRQLGRRRRQGSRPGERRGRRRRGRWPTCSISSRGYGRPVKIHNEGDDWEAALLEIARAHPAAADHHRPLRSRDAERGRGADRRLDR